jgi:hypothetical protein
MNDVMHRGVGYMHAADPFSRPGPATMLLIRTMVHGDAALEQALGLEHDEYIRRVPGWVAEWKATLSTFADQLKRKDLPSVTAKPWKTHGSKLVLRWVLHVFGPFYSEMRRLNDLAQPVDMGEHLPERRAVMGLIMVHAMARGDKFMYVNEVELVWGSKNTRIQSRHLDGGEKGLLANLIVLNRDPKLSTWHTNVCGLRHNDPRFMSVPEHGWRVHLMRRQYQADPDQGGRAGLHTSANDVDRGEGTRVLPVPQLQ